MEEIEGTILKLGTEDRNGRIFGKDCIINYPEKIPITIGYNFDKPDWVVGNAEIIRDNDTLSIKGEIINGSDNIYGIQIYTHLGFYANNVKTKDNNVISMFIRSVALLSEKEAALDYCKIIKKENNII